MATALTTKKQLLERLGHSALDHSTQPHHAARRRLIYGGTPCGWRWCEKDLDSRATSELANAIGYLEGHGIRPDGLDVITVAEAVLDVERLERNRDLLNSFLGAARKLRSALWPNGRVEDLRNYNAVRAQHGPSPRADFAPPEWYFAQVRAPDHLELLDSAIEKFEPLAAAARTVRPAGQHAGTKNALRAALARLGVLRKWTIGDIAAALYLTGVVRGTRKQIDARLRKVRARSLTSKVTQTP